MIPPFGLVGTNEFRCQKRLASIEFSGSIGLANDTILPGFAGTPARLIGGFCVSEVLLLQTIAGLRRSVSTRRARRRICRWREVLANVRLNTAPPGRGAPTARAGTRDRAP